MIPQKPTRRILFLDVDGVLNTTASLLKNKSNSVFVAEAVEELGQIVAQTGCDVVISSTWREDQADRLLDALDLHGLQNVCVRIIGMTPVFSSSDLPCREDEIDAWLHQEAFCGRIAVIDDEPICGDLCRWAIQVSPDHGLTRHLAERAVNLLMSGPVFRAGM